MPARSRTIERWAAGSKVTPTSASPAAFVSSWSAGIRQIGLACRPAFQPV